MQTKKVTATLSLMMLLSGATVTPAQQKAAVSSDWTVVKTVTVGDKISVKLSNGKKVDGRMGSVSDSLLTLSRKNQSVEIARADVKQVYRLTPRSAARKTAIGAGVGAAAGLGAFGAGAGITHGGIEAGLLPISMLAGAGIGALIGAVSGIGHKRVLVYDAK